MDRRAPRRATCHLALALSTLLGWAPAGCGSGPAGGGSGDSSVQNPQGELSDVNLENEAQNLDRIKKATAPASKKR